MPASIYIIAVFSVNVKRTMKRIFLKEVKNMTKAEQELVLKAQRDYKAVHFSIHGRLSTA